MVNKNYLIEKKIVLIKVFMLIVILLLNYFVRSYYGIDNGYKWAATIQTSHGFPIIVSECNFNHTGFCSNDIDFNILYAEDDMYHDNQARSYEALGLYPNNLNILYYSVNENKFYKGKFKFNYDEIVSNAEKYRNAVTIEDYMRTKSIDFNVKILPKGKMELSMNSYIKTSLEDKKIATFYAKKEKHDWSVFEVNKNQRESVGKTNSTKIQGTLLFKKYNWKIEFITESDNLRGLNIDVFGYRDVEVDTIQNTKMPTFSNINYLPKKIGFYSNSRSYDLKFNERKMIKAFNTVSKNGTLPIKMKIIIRDERLKGILEGNNKTIELKKFMKYTMEVY